MEEIISGKSSNACSNDKENSFNSSLLKPNLSNQSQKQNIINNLENNLIKESNIMQNNIKINQEPIIYERVSENVDVENGSNSIPNNKKINQVKKHSVCEIDSENINVGKESNGQSNLKINKVKKRSVHGTGSKVARTKLELEKQWLEHLQIIQQKYEDRRNHDENEHKRKIEELELKREKLNLKKKNLC